MFIIARLIVFELVVALTVSACYDKSNKATSSGETNLYDEDQVEAGQNGASLDATAVQWADATINSAFDSGTDALTSDLCRVVELIGNTTDDAGEIDADLSGPTISGVISIEGDCLPNLEICLTLRKAFEAEWINAFTNQYGKFELPTNLVSGSIQYYESCERAFGKPWVRAACRA